MTNLSRRQFVGGSALAASALTLAACDGNGGSASADAGKADVEKSTIIVFAARQNGIRFIGCRDV